VYSTVQNAFMFGGENGLREIVRKEEEKPKAENL
jgi:hypothetical protein